MVILDVATAFAAGALTGAGVGGGTLLLLYLTQVRQMEQLTAQGINLLYYVAAAAPSLFFHLRHGLVEKKGGCIALCWGVPGCLAGAFLAGVLEPALLRRAFGLLLTVMGVRQLLASRKKKTKEPPQREERPPSR